MGGGCCLNAAELGAVRCGSGGLGRASGRVCVAAAAAAAKAMLWVPKHDSWKSDLYSSFCLSKKLENMKRKLTIGFLTLHMGKQ